MKLFKRKESFLIKIFVTGSFLGLFILGALLFLIKINLVTIFQEKQEVTKKIFQEQYQTTDPFITKVISWKDSLKSPIISKFDPSQGNRKGRVVIVYFSDFECDYCYQQEQEIRKVMEEFKDDVYLIRKDYPRTNQDSFSWKASIAGRCALEQGKFWEFDDALYKEITKDGKIDKEKIESDEYSSLEYFSSLASKIGMRKGLFANCLLDKEIAGLIQGNILEAQALGITSIPFVYINDKELMGEVSYEDLKMVITKELESKD